MTIRAPTIVPCLRHLAPCWRTLGLLGLLWALTLTPVRPPGAAWWECALALGVLLGARGVLQRGVAPILGGSGESLRLTDTFVTLAALSGCCVSFLLVALEACGRLPSMLRDPRGGPTLLCAAAGTAVAVRHLVTHARRSSTALLDSSASPEPEVSSPGAWALPTVLFAGAALSALTALMWATPLGLLETTATGMAILVAVSPESVRVLRDYRRLALRQVRSMVGHSSVEPDLQAAARVDWVLFERSGVLTTGEHRVAGVHTLQPGVEREDVLHFTALAEYGVNHPIRDAILRSYHSHNRTVARVKTADLVEERGVRANHQGRELLVGNLQLFREAGWDAAKLAILAQNVRLWATRGETVIFAAFGGELVGALSLLDPLREGACATLEELRRLGVEPAVQSGDAPESVTTLLGEVPGLEIHAGLAPGEDRALITKRQQEGRHVAKVTRCARGTPNDAICLDWGAAHPAANVDSDVSEDEDSEDPLPDPARSLHFPVEHLGDLVLFFSMARRVSRGERRARTVLVLYHLLLVPLVAGALLPGLGAATLPAVAAAAGGLLPRLVRSLLPGEPQG